MEPVMMRQFVDFVLSPGPSRIVTVKQLKKGQDERFSDFYRPVRDAIVDMHSAGLSSAVLDDLLSSLVDPRERRIFPKVVNGYKKLLGTGKITWFEPPQRDWPLGPISVRVNPELGLLIDGRPHAVKMYFGGVAPSPQHVLATNQILGMSLSATWPGTVFATLDVRRARLYPWRPKSDIIGLLLKVDAAAFASLWGSL